MALLHQIQYRTIGFTGAPGFTTLHFRWSADAQTLPQYDAVKAFLGGLGNQFATPWQAQIEPTGRILDEASGELVSFTAVDATNGALVNALKPVGTGAGVAGAVIGLTTNTINRGRKIRGRIFMVPLAKDAYDNDGTLTPATITSFQVNTQTLQNAAVGFGVWSRPRLSVGGLLGLVVSARVNDQAAFLSSRRR